MGAAAAEEKPRRVRRTAAVLREIRAAMPAAGAWKHT
eukprot:gene7724-7561_t